MANAVLPARNVLITSDCCRLIKSRDAIRKIFTAMEIQVARRGPGDYFILQPPGLAVSENF
jgi:hypothetical protein